MPDIDTTPTDLPQSITRKQRAARLILQGAFLFAESVAFICLIDRVAAGDWERAAWVGQFVLSLGAASVALYCAAVRRRKVYDPLRRLQNILPDVHAGRIPIDELSKIGGAIAPLAAHMQEILRELRIFKGDMAHELRERVASKTEALERKIGSLKQQATKDALTGLLNRRALDEHLAKAFERRQVSGASLSVLMIDVDNFKPLNDTLGHAAGDDLLRSIGQILRSTLRPCDAAFRCGGDEFVVVMETTDAPAARVLGDRLTSLVDGLVRTLRVPALPRLSIGSACMDDLSEQTTSALLHEADKVLYAVKASRKGRIPRGTTPEAEKPPARRSA